MINFKKTSVRIQKIVFVVTMTFLSWSADAFEFTYNGATYQLSTVTGWTANEALLKRQVWWGKENLATAFAQALNNTNNMPSETNFAYRIDANSSFGVGIYDYNSRVTFQQTSSSAGVGRVGSFLTSNGSGADLTTFAVVTPPFCPSNSSPLVDCPDLILTNPSSTITIPNGLTVYKNISYAIDIGAGSTTNSLVNNGTIDGGTQTAVYAEGRIATFNNTGTITTASRCVLFPSISCDTNPAIYLPTSASSIGSLINSGSINTTGFEGGRAIFVDAGARVSSITNTGVISSATDYGIVVNDVGSVSVLNNAQGGDGSTPFKTALKYKGALPTAYNVIINSPRYFGQLSVVSPEGSMAFGVYGGERNFSPVTYTNASGTTSTIAASIVVAGTYSNVLQGFTTLGSVTGTTGTYSGYSYSLVAGALPGYWDLNFTAATTLSSGSTNALGSLASTSSVALDGGKLAASGNATISAPISLTGSSSVQIDPAGYSSVFSGAITASGTSSLAIASSSDGGVVTLNASGNAVPGGVTVSSGTLAIGDINNPNASIAADVAISPASTLQGHGTVVGSVSNAGGTVKPGGSIGTLTINGNYTETAASTLSIELDPNTTSLLQVNGVASIAGKLQLVAVAGTYGAKQYTILNATGGLSGSFSSLSNNFSVYTPLAYNLSYDANNVYVNLYAFGLAETQYSLHTLAPKLRTGFSSQAIATNFANMNTYDCDLFDAKGVCVSVGGQQTYVDNPSSNMTSTVVVAGYKVSPNIRIGGFLNQNINNNTVSGVHISNANPLMGLFAVWNQNEDRLGYQVKIANAYQDKDVTTTRDVIGTSEAGTGSTTLNTQSYVGELSYAFLANEDKTLVRPYAALRYTRIKQDGYTEDATVSAPLTYAALSDRSTAALIGIKLNHRLVDKVNLTASLGVEQDLYHHVDKLVATGVADLTSENFNNNIKRTRPVASIGAYYMPVKNQRIAADIYYQQLPFQSTGSTTAYVNYTIGF